MKSKIAVLSYTCITVASLAEAWIEMIDALSRLVPGIVASLAEAWIEIDPLGSQRLAAYVASLAEAWIEI